MQQPNRYTVDGLDFIINKLPPSKSIPLSYRIARGLLPAIGAALGEGAEVMDVKNLLDKDVASVVPVIAKALGKVAIPKLLTDVQPEELRSWMQELFAPCQCVRGDKMLDVNKNFDQVFYDHERTAYALLYQCIEVNFGSFFGESGLGGLRAKVAGLMASSAQKGSDSSGQSGDSSPTE